MKKILIGSALLFASMTYAQAETLSAPVKHLYIPQGFDNNDSVEVVVTGTFPNPCYSRNTVEVEIKNDEIFIDISAIRRDQKKVCPQVLVPFKEVVSLGNLQGGNYHLNVNNKLHDTLVVEESSSNSVDEHLYAAIDQLEKIEGDNYMLRGWRYSQCLVLDRIEVVSNGKDTFSVLPILKQISQFCPMKGMPVAYPVKLDLKKLKIGQPLIHVRTMDGKSFNTILNQEGQM